MKYLRLLESQEDLNKLIESGDLPSNNIVLITNGESENIILNGDNAFNPIGSVTQTSPISETSSSLVTGKQVAEYVTNEINNLWETK